MNFLLIILSIIGFITAAVAAYGRYYDLPSFLTGPVTCQMEGKGCQVLFRTKRATIFGIPNAFLGMVFYPLLIFGIVNQWDRRLLFLFSSVALMSSVRLAVGLIQRKLQCRICWMGHFTNLFLWILLLIKGWILV